jgi:hypothetical protein
MNRWIPLALIVIGLGFGLSQCKSEKEFKAEGIITNQSNTGIEVKSLVPNPLKTNIRECYVINITEQEVKCNEQKENLTYTHSIKTKDIPDKVKESLHIGMNVSLHLPILKSIPLYIPQQVAFIPLVNIHEGLPVFISGTYKDKNNDIKIKGVYELEKNNTSISVLTPTSPTSSTSNNTLPNSFPTNSYSGPIKVCVPNNFLNTNNQLTFNFFRREGIEVIKYELMHPNVQVDKVGSGTILEEPGMKLLMMSPDLTGVEGIEVINNNINCVNPENTPVPPWRNKSVAAMSTNTTTKYVKQNKGGNNSTVWAGLNLIRFLGFIVFNIIGYLWMITWL